MFLISELAIAFEDSHFIEKSMNNESGDVWKLFHFHCGIKHGDDGIFSADKEVGIFPSAIGDELRHAAGLSRPRPSSQLRWSEA